MPTSSRRLARRAAGLAVLAALLGSAGCAASTDEPTSGGTPTTAPDPSDPSDPPDPSATPGAFGDATSRTLDLPGGPGLVLTPAEPNGRLVLYVHGSGETEQSLVTEPLKAPTVAALLDDGYTVAAARAHGNAWGNPASVRDYVALHDRLAPTDGTFVLAQSMGGIVGLRLPDLLPDVRAVAAVYPACDMRSVAVGPLARAMVRAWGRDRIAAALDELSPALARHVDGLPVEIWASPDDTVVPADENGFACGRELERRGADVTVVRAHGQHGDPSHFDADAVVALFHAG